MTGSLSLEVSEAIKDLLLSCVLSGGMTGFSLHRRYSQQDFQGKKKPLWFGYECREAIGVSAL